MPTLGLSWGYLYPQWSNREKIKDALKEFRFVREFERELDAGGIDEVMREKIRNSIEGISEYDDLSKEDIDRVIRDFEEVKRLIRNAI